MLSKKYIKSIFLLLFHYFLLSSLPMVAFYKSSPTLLMTNQYDTTEDSDEDGLTDFEELQLKTNPFLYDTDLDGLGDGDEIYLYGTNPLKRDTFNDGLYDGARVLLKQPLYKKTPKKEFTYTLEKYPYTFTLSGDGNFSVFLDTYFPFQNDVIAIYSPNPFEKGIIEVKIENAENKILYIWQDNKWLPLKKEVSIEKDVLRASISSYGFFVVTDKNSTPTPINPTKTYESGFDLQKDSFSFSNPQGDFLAEKNGLCFGVVAVSKLQYENILPKEKNFAFIPYSIKTESSIYKTSFESYENAIRHWFWKQSNFLWFVENFQFISNSIKDLEKIKNQIKSNKTIIFGLNHWEYNLPEGHAVLGYAAKEDLLTKNLKVLIYDPNFPFLTEAQMFDSFFKENLTIDFIPLKGVHKNYYTFSYDPFKKPENAPYITLEDYKWSSTSRYGNLYFSIKNFINN